MVQVYTDYVIVVLFSLWLFSQIVVACTVAKASEAQPGKGATPSAMDPSVRAHYFSWWKWSSVTMEVSGAGLTAAVVVHLLLCTSADMHFFNNHFFINGSM